MTDLVERLRARKGGGDDEEVLMREAADEIERLRAALTRIAGKGPAAEDTLACEMREIARAALTFTPSAPSPTTTSKWKPPPPSEND